MGQRRARLLYGALTLADAAGRRLRTRGNRSRPQLGAYGPGVTVIIPERANSEILTECLDRAAAACVRVSEPSEIIVVASGSPASAYCALMQRHQQVRWIFSERPLWYSRAIRTGLRAARFDWVYLLNNDMMLDPLALQASMQWRSPEVFAVASQVFFRDERRRREETGWTLFRGDGGPIQIMDEVPGDEVTVRGTFYAGGGASLFRRDLLRVLSVGSNVYEPFYWEDVEWGERAWRFGYPSLYCPASKAWHLHRMTNRIFFREAEIDRILARNRVVYHLRNGPPLPAFREFARMLSSLDDQSRREALTFGRMARIACGRLASARQATDMARLGDVWEIRYGHIDEPVGKP